MNGVKKGNTRKDTMSDRKSDMSDASSSRRSKMRFKMKMKMMNMGVCSIMPGAKGGSVVVYENTYKTEPQDDLRFSKAKAEEIIYSTMENYLSQREYDAKRFPSLSKILSELIKERVKASGLDRYKIVAVVSLCENKDQGTRMASRCLWDPLYDNYASVVYKGANFFAVGSVYAVYFD
ncbi:hypothetical protein ACOMHN_033682 [Nucella lapillus]